MQLELNVRGATQGLFYCMYTVASILYTSSDFHDIPKLLEVENRYPRDTYVAVEV